MPTTANVPQILGPNGDPITRATRTTSEARVEMYRRRLAKMISYKAATRDSNFDSWIAGQYSADAAILPSMEDLRARARDRERNDPIAGSIVNSIVDATVGKGMFPQSRVSYEDLGVSESVAEEWQVACERWFRKSKKYLDASGSMTFEAMQRQCVRRLVVDGEYLAHRTRVNGPNRPTDLAFERIEADRLSSPSSAITKQLDSGREIRMGVELGMRGQPVGYWVSHHHPGDLGIGARRNRKWTRFRARNRFGHKNVLHVFDPWRPGQTRGVSALADVLILLKLLDDIFDAELLGKRCESSIGIIREQSDFTLDDHDSDYDDEIDEWSPVMDIKAGPGETIKLIDPKRPGTTFEPFVRRVLVLVGAGKNMPLEILTRDYRETTYSSARAAELDFMRHIESAWRPIVVDGLCQPIYAHSILDGWLRGELPQVDLLSNFDAWTNAHWSPDGKKWVDPKKEADADHERIEKGTMTRAEYWAGRSKDWRDQERQIAREKKFRQELEAEMGIEPEPNMQQQSLPGFDEGGMDE